MEEIAESEIISSEVLVAGDKPFVVVGIPAFNEEHSIARVVLETKKYADAIVVCDDGSSDLTGEIARNLGVYVIRHEQNLGYGAALKTLFRCAREFKADILITLDADGQHEPKEISEIILPIIEGSADLVVGSRFVEGNRVEDILAPRRWKDSSSATVCLPEELDARATATEPPREPFAAFGGQTPYEVGSVLPVLQAKGFHWHFCQGGPGSGPSGRT